ncbi:MAG: type II toxin-antitoxin system YafQ family toxin [bacterium]
MLKPSYARQFEKDLKKLLKSGKSGQKIKKLMLKLINQEKLEERHRAHQLKGEFKNRHECHIEPDWLLIYKLEEDRIIFELTGSHSELFR